MDLGMEDSEIRRKNGEIVVSALKIFSEPATLTNVVKYVAETQKVSASAIKEPIKEILMAGVAYGFIKKSGEKYSIAGDDEYLEPSDGADSDVDLEDRSRRRGRRGRGRSRKRRSRTRSRSRRRRG